MTNYCKCGCGTEIADDKTWFYGHNVRDPVTRKKISETLIGREVSDTTKKKLSESLTGYKHSDTTKKKMSVSQSGNTNALGYKHSDTARKKISEANIEHYAEMDDPGQQICKHHYIYDFNDWDKYTISVTKSEHLTIHNNLRHAGLEVPCINIMVGD